MRILVGTKIKEPNSIFHRYSLRFHPSLRSSFTLCTVFSLVSISTFFFIMPRSFARTHLKISVTSGRGSPAEVATTKRSIQELSGISAFVQARVRSPLTRCKNRGCARRTHPRTYLCYDSRHLHSTECQRIMVALLDDTLLDYRTTYPFLLVVDVALYLLLEKDYFQRQIATYALLTLQESYFSTDFLLVIYDLLTNNYEDFAHYLYLQYCSRASTIVTAAHNLYPSLFHVAIILIYFLFLTFSSTYLIYVRSLFT